MESNFRFRVIVKWQKKEETPDWLADVLKEAEARTEEAPALSPPPVNEKRT